MQKNPCRVDDPLQNPIDRESYEDAVSLEDGIYPITTDDNTIISSDMVKHGNETVEDALTNLNKSFTKLQSSGQYIAIPAVAKEIVAYGKYSTSSDELYIGYFNVDVLDAQGSGTFWDVGRGYYYVYDSSVRHFTVTQYNNGQQSAEHMVIYWR